MKTHLLSQLTCSSALWHLSEDEFREYLVIPAVSIARECHFVVLNFELDGETLRILLSGRGNVVELFRKRFKEHTERVLKIVKPRYSNCAFTNVYYIAEITDNFSSTEINKPLPAIIPFSQDRTDSVGRETPLTYQPP